jgi:hypothetical protein
MIDRRITKATRSMSMGRTGPAQVLSCGCGALPWEPCECEPWDTHLSLDRVIERAQLEMTEYPDEPYSEPAKPVLAASTAEALSVSRMRSLLGQCRQVARWSARKHGYKGDLARTVVTSIDRILQGGELA